MDELKKTPLETAEENLKKLLAMKKTASGKDKVKIGYQIDLAKMEVFKLKALQKKAVIDKQDKIVNEKFRKNDAHIKCQVAPLCMELLGVNELYKSLKTIEQQNVFFEILLKHINSMPDFQKQYCKGYIADKVKADVMEKINLADSK